MLEPLQKLLIMRHIKIHRVFEVKISVWGFVWVRWLGCHPAIIRGFIDSEMCTCGGIRARAYAFTHPCAAPRTKTQSGRRELCLPVVGKLSGNFSGFAYQQPAGSRSEQPIRQSAVILQCRTRATIVWVCNNAANASFPTCVDQMMCAREQNMCCSCPHTR